MSTAEEAKRALQEAARLHDRRDWRKANKRNKAYKSQADTNGLLNRAADAGSHWEPAGICATLDLEGPDNPITREACFTGTRGTCE